MEKPAAAAAAPAGKLRYKLLKLLPKAASAVNFQNHPFSPGREKMRPDPSNWNKARAHMGKGFSGPIVSIIPEEARGKTKNSSLEDPTSPKVSCRGQIKHRKQKLDKKGDGEVNKKKKQSGFFNIFSSPRGGRKSGPCGDAERGVASSESEAGRKPGLGEMKRFASGRESLANFDWTKAQIAPEDDLDQRGCYSDEDRGEEEEEEEEEEREVIIPFSAPILVGDGGRSSMNLEPRKEINIWKRRTMVQPKPLQLNT